MKKLLVSLVLAAGVFATTASAAFACTPGATYEQYWNCGGSGGMVITYKCAVHGLWYEYYSHRTIWGSCG